MSKIDDLVEVFHANYVGSGIMTEIHNIRSRAGIAAVVRAVRDECDRVLPCDRKFSRAQVWDVFNEILGSDAGEKVAEDPLPHLSEREKALFVAALKGDAGPITPPATDPAPAPCLWRVHHETRNGPLYVSQCDGEWRHATADPKCPSCGKPIKFTEAK